MSRKAVIFCVGDVQFDGPVDIDTSLSAYMHAADVVFGNLEAPLSMKGHPVNKVITLRTDPKYVSELQKMNLKVVTLANNHILDFGTEAMYDTMEKLDEQGISFVGAGRNKQEAVAPVFFSVGSLQIAFMGVACTLPLDFAANPHKPGIAPIRIHTYIRIDPSIEQEQPGTPPFIHTEPDPEDLNHVINTVKQTKQKADYLILGIHWGVPFQDHVLDYQLKIAEALTNAGVDMIIGHHPHTLHGVAKSNQKMVFYSLGNFVFHYKPSGELVKKFSKIMGNMQGSPFSTVAKITFMESETDIELVPVFLNAKGNPRLAKNHEVDFIISRLNTLSSELNDGCSFVKTAEGMIRIT